MTSKENRVAGIRKEMTNDFAKIDQRLDRLETAVTEIQQAVTQK